MSQWPNYNSWLRDVPATTAVLCIVWMLSTPAVAADPDGAPAVESGAASSSPANAGLELNFATQTLISEMDAGPPEPPAVEDSPLVTRENITIRRSGQTQEPSAVPSPWYRSGLASLGLVLGVIIVVGLVIKRVAKTSHGGGSGVLQVLTRTHLSPKQSIAVVQMGGRLVFVGITPEQISMLRIVEDREEAALLRGQLRVGAAELGGPSFDKHLSREAKELTDGLDVGVEASCDVPNPQSGAKEDLTGLLQRLRDFQGGTGHQPSAKRKLMADS